MGRAFCTVSTVLLTLLLFIPSTLPGRLVNEKTPTQAGITDHVKTVECRDPVHLSCDRGVLLIRSINYLGHRAWPYSRSPSTADLRKKCDGKRYCFEPLRDCFRRDEYKVSYSCKDVEDDPCKKKPCEHGACVAKSGHYTCDCERGWTGKNCNDRKTDCHSTCENGICERVPWYPYGLSSSYRCECDRGWSGQNCDQETDPCRRNPCQNGACIPTDRGRRYSCVCDPGWTGKNCDQQTDPCEGNPCDQGVCIADGAGYTCNCRPGWTGKNCNLRIDFCKGNLCLHGTCENQNDGYKCKCFSGWSGGYCRQDINECYAKPCHFGTCVNTEGGYSCRCDHGWTGQNCTKAAGDKMTMYLGHGSRGRLVCPHGVLDVVSAQYRRDPAHGCQGQPKACLACDDHHLDQPAKTSVRGRCNGRWYCDVIATSSFLLKGPDSCGHVRKDLEVGYRCVEGQNRETPTELDTTASKNSANTGGPSLTVICRSTGDPPPNITWRLGDKVLTGDDNNKHTVVEKRGGRGGESYLEAKLTIADLASQSSDDERFICMAGHNEDNGTEASSMVKVLVSGIVITVAGIGAAAFSIYFFRRSSLSRKRDTDSSTSLHGLHGSASPMPGRLRPLPSLPKTRWSMASKRESASIAIMDFLKPIPITMLKKEFNRRLANEEKLFTYEYEALPKLLGEEHSQACQKNRDKNRFRNIISYDHSRVILSLVGGDPRSDYINASYIDGYKEEKKYIATQGPMQNTVQDFWRMVWETRSSTILMLSNLVENCQNKVCKYWSETDMMTYGEFHVVLTDTEKMDFYIARTFLLTKDNVTARREVTQFHFLAWPDFGVPDDPTDLLKFHQIVMKSVCPRPQNHPIVVHCSAGVGRTGTFITIDAMLEMMAVEKQVDVFGYVSKMRRNRSFMVQAKAQYVFIYQALLDSHLREELKQRKWKLWPPSAVISQIKMATARRNSEDARAQKGENEI
ncbi:uncharacterized protein LOC118416213 [Branchiostoma floridae]|uniref:protein-tyrosine-phosphatase n=1 Tax=Branchiostoma floridae TaxID=7739 RepID=A0A9J7L8B2_BRAFL|nr:uncharacterized protein LOC118416213 [Branchiostoma floridae]